LIFKNFGFKGQCPVAKFEEVSIKDETQFNRVVTRMMELGILPPEEGIKVIETGIYPTTEELESAQEKFVEQRKKGFYNPIVGGVPTISSPSKEDLNINDKEKNKIKVPNEVGRPVGTTSASVYSRESIANVFDLTKSLYSEVQGLLKKKYNIKRLNKNQKKFAEEISEAIIIGSKSSTWNKTANQVLNNPSELDSLGILKEVQNLANEHDLNLYAAALLYHSVEK